MQMLGVHRTASSQLVLQRETQHSPSYNLETAQFCNSDGRCLSLNKSISVQNGYLN